jgi:hypothetical protein
MLNEQIIAAVTRTSVITVVREIEAVVSFARTLRLHLWLHRMPLGMPAYSGSMSGSLSLGSDKQPGNSGTINPNPGSKRGRRQCQPILAFASCPAGIANA